MSSPPPPPQQPRRSAGDGKKTTPPASVVTRNAARKAKIQTRAMSAGAKPSASVIAAKKKAQQKKKSNFNSELRDPYQIAMESKSKVKGATGFVTEPRMAEHRCLWDDKYPECPERLTSIIKRCNELNLIEQCEVFPPRAATKEELSVLHSPTVYEMMEATHQNEDAEFLEDVSSKYDAIYIHPSTHELALIAAGSTIDMVDRVASGALQNGAAFVRPPGHHAMRAEPCGYCFYNNVALAARHAIDKRGLKRILIVDWDVHHGQATQQMFYDDPRVVYFSIHRYEHGAFWPSLRQADFQYAGAGRGRGATFNVPLNATGMADADYVAIWHQLLLPMAFEYQPELILISAGYDAAYGCPEGEMEVTPACFASLVHMLMCVSPAVCVVLEGGYCAASLAEGAALTLRTLLGHAPPALAHYKEPCDSVRESILNCIYTHKLHWNCFNYQPTYCTSGPPNVCDRAKQKHTVVVKWEGDETRPESFATRDCYPVQDDGTKRRIAEKLNHLRIVTDLSTPQHAVCYTYDQAMLKHRSVKEPDHVECPERVERIHERHRDFGLLRRVRALPARAATDEQIVAVHTHDHLQRLKELAMAKIRDIIYQRDMFDSVYFHPESLQSAAMAAGCVVQTVDEVVTAAAGCGVCVVRPPGHHADEDVPSGFCLLNNAVIGARHALRAHRLRRVLLLDWDVHHGNGTQALTYDDDRILYVSIHRYDNGTFFPNSTDANYTETGEGRGEGFNVNIPWNKRGMGDTEYLAAFTNIILPIAYEYNPELVIVSAGFDACVGDPLGGCKVTPECYGRMTQLLRGLAGGRVILCLEGGYNVTSISYAMTMCTKALLGDPILNHYDHRPICHWSAIDTINNVIQTQKNYWKSLKFQLALPLEDVLAAPPRSRGLMEDYHVKETATAHDTKPRPPPPRNLSKSAKAIQAQILNILDSNMASLRVQNKCPDGLHCGTDDEEPPGRSQNEKETGRLEKEVDEKETRHLKTENESGSSKNKCVQGGSNACAEKKVSDQGGSSAEAEKKSSDRDVEKRTLVDYLAENMHELVDGDMFAVIPLPWCPHLESLYALPSDVNFEQGVKCVDCDHTAENWVCLHCYIPACARSVRGHMQAHLAATRHALVLSLSDLSVWCNECDAYVDNALLYDVKNNAHRCKFHEDMPWCYHTDTIRME